MDLTMELLQQIWGACLELLGQPFYYIGILFVVLLYRRQIHLERKMFLTKLHSFFIETWKTLLIAIVTGFMISLIMVLFGIVINAEVIIGLWIITLLMILFRARFFCFAYCIGIIGILHSVVTFIPLETNIAFFDSLITSLQQIKMSSLLALVAVIHLLEAILIRWYSPRSASPAVFQGKRGKLVGGYQIQGFWAVPLFLLVPVQSGTSLNLSGTSLHLSGTSFQLPWTPLLSGDLGSSGWMLLGVPIVMGFAEMTKSWLPKVKSRSSSSFIFIYSVIIMALAFGVEYLPFNLPFLTLFASLLCILLHEAIIWFGAWKESQTPPLYIHDNRGLFILGTIKGSPAEKLGLEAGEIIRQVNGMKVASRDELHQAFNINSAFCKLEVLNLDGQIKFLKRAMFSGEHHQLGIILAPDDNTDYYITMKQKSIISYLWLKTGVFFKNTHLDIESSSSSNERSSKASTSATTPSRSTTM